jgi:hypothetical protein
MFDSCNHVILRPIIHQARVREWEKEANRHDLFRRIATSIQ